MWRHSELQAAQIFLSSYVIMVIKMNEYWVVSCLPHNNMLSWSLYFAPLLSHDGNTIWLFPRFVWIWNSSTVNIIVGSRQTASLCYQTRTFGTRHHQTRVRLLGLSQPSRKKIQLIQYFILVTFFVNWKCWKMIQFVVVGWWQGDDLLRQSLSNQGFFNQNFWSNVFIIDSIR